MGEAHFTTDPLRALGALPAADLDPRAARRIRDRAVALLESRRRRTPRRLAVLAATLARFAQPVLAAGLSLGFAAWALSRSVSLLQHARGGFFWP